MNLKHLGNNSEKAMQKQLKDTRPIHCTEVLYMAASYCPSPENQDVEIKCLSLALEVSLPEKKPICTIYQALR